MSIGFVFDGSKIGFYDVGVLCFFAGRFHGAASKGHRPGISLVAIV